MSKGLRAVTLVTALIATQALLPSRAAVARAPAASPQPPAEEEPPPVDEEPVPTEEERPPDEAQRPPAEAEEPGETESEEPPSAEELREAAEAAAAGAEESAPSQPAKQEESEARNLSRLNPEISFTGDFLGSTVDGNDTVASDEDFDLREFELDLQSDLDPFSRAKLTIAFSPEEDEVEIEEGYMIWSGLGHGLSLTAGKLRQQLGLINRWHLHSLPQVDYPLALTTLFGEEGLAQTGLRLGWLVPRPWAHANELTVELTDGDNEAFGGESFERLVGLVHLKNYWDVSDATYFEWGLTGVNGRAAGDFETTVAASDITLHWQPPARAKYREVTWRTEVFYSLRDDPLGVEQESWSGYSYLEALVRRNLYVGLRYDRAEDPVVPELESEGVLVNVTWWQSEYVRLRGEYGHVDHAGGEDEDRFALQLTWSAGPHKHERY